MAKKGATGDFFFQFCQKKKKNLKMDNIFMEKKKEWEKKQMCGRPTGFNFSHPLDRKQNFCYGQPNRGVVRGGVVSTLYKHESPVCVIVVSSL